MVFGAKVATMGANIKKEKKVSKQVGKIPFYTKRSSVVYFPKFPTFNPEEFESELERPCTDWSVERIRIFVVRLEHIKSKRGRTTNDKFWINISALLNLANGVFGFSGWSTHIVDSCKVLHSDVYYRENGNVRTDHYFEKIKAEQEIDIIDTDTFDEKTENENGTLGYDLEIETTVKLILKDGTSVQSLGTGKVTNLPLKSLSFHTAKKAAVSDATKNCFLKLTDLLENHRDRWTIRQFNWN